MSTFVCRTRLHLKTTEASLVQKLFSLQYNHPLSTSSPTLKCTSNSSNKHSFTISYLINTCGFPLEKAVAASNYINFETPHKPDSVLELFKNQGFTETQISKLVKRYPPVLLCDPQKTLMPKLEYLSSIGLSTTELTQIITSTPNLLKRSLENRIIPSFNFFKTFLQSQQKAVVAIKRFNMLLGYDLETCLAPNIKTLRNSGVPESSIMVLLTYQPRAFMTDAERFKNIVDEVKKMGFNPLRHKFILAVHALRAMSKSTWERKVEVYKKWGFSEDEIFVAFGRHPWCMMASEDKITGVMDFLVNKMGLEYSVIVARPALMSLSLSKRIIPRCSVCQVMLAKGLIKKNYSLCTLLESPEEKFVNNIMKRYKKNAPELLKHYQEKLDLAK